jgi:hypothetical protein
MSNGLRVATGIVLGTIAAFVLVGVIEAIGEVVYPPPPGLDLRNADALATYVERLPAGALAFVLVAWIAGTFVGGLVAAWIARPHAVVVAAVVGALVLAATIANVMLIPHPTWMVVAGVAGIAIAAWIAGRLMRSSQG